MSSEVLAVVSLTIGILGAKLFNSADGARLPPSYGPPTGWRANLGGLMMLIGFGMALPALHAVLLG